VHDLKSAIAQYRAAFDLPMPRGERNAQFGADLAWFEDTPIALAQGSTDGSWLNRRVREFGDAPCAFILKTAAEVATAPPNSSLFSSLPPSSGQRPRSLCISTEMSFSIRRAPVAEDSAH
jgi:hypothetical protein